MHVTFITYAHYNTIKKHIVAHRMSTNFASNLYSVIYVSFDEFMRDVSHKSLDGVTVMQFSESFDLPSIYALADKYSTIARFYCVEDGYVRSCDEHGNIDNTEKLKRAERSKKDRARREAAAAKRIMRANQAMLNSLRVSQ